MFHVHACILHALMFHVHVHVLACDFQATKGVVVELEEEMSVSELAKKMKTNPGEGATTSLVFRFPDLFNVLVQH